MKLIIQHDNYGNIQAVSSYAMGVPDDFGLPPGSFLVDSDIPESILVNEYKLIENSLVRVGAPADAEIYDLNITTLNWEINISKLKAVKRATIKRARGIAEYAGFTWAGSTFDSNAISQQRIASAVQLASLSKAANQPFSITWTLADDTLRTLTADEMIQVGLALGEFVQTNFQKAQALQQQIDAATTKEEVEAVVWT